MRRTFIPHLFESMSSPTTKLGGFKSRASVGVTGGRPSVPHHWGQRSTWVFRFLGNAPFVPRQKIPLSKFSPRMKRLKPDFNRAQRDSRVFLFFFFFRIGPQQVIVVLLGPFPFRGERRSLISLVVSLELRA